LNEYDHIGRELRETRAEPTPEFARALDERAAEILRERPRRRMPSLRIAIPAVATVVAAAVVIALVISGGDDEGGRSKLQVAVISDQGALDAVGGGQAEALSDRESEAAPKLAEGGFASPKAKRVAEGEPVVVRFFFTAPTGGTVEFAAREASVKVPAGAGRLEISTEGLPAGTERLVITVRSMPPYRQRIEIGD
jgi:hypothetical protein